MNTEFRDVCVSVQIMFQGGLVPHLTVHQHYTPISTTTCRLSCNELKYLQMCSATSRCLDGWLGGNLFQKAKRITKLPPITAVGCNKLLDVVCKTSVPVGIYAGRCGTRGENRCRNMDELHNSTWKCGFNFVLYEPARWWVCQEP